MSFYGALYCKVEEVGQEDTSRRTRMRERFVNEGNGREKESLEGMGTKDITAVKNKKIHTDIKNTGSKKM